MSESLVDKQVRLVLEQQCSELGREIAASIPAGTGFAMLLFDFGERGNLAYFSNANRADMTKALEELLEKWKRE